jgi:translation elongation factor EF-Tu-like GTPase
VCGREPQRYLGGVFFRSYGLAQRAGMSLEAPRYGATVAVTFDADVQLLSADEGGRETPLTSGYRSLARIGPDENSELWGVEITFDAQTELAPGQAAFVHVAAWAWPEGVSPQTADTPVRVYEGARLVARGRVR